MKNIIVIGNASHLFRLWEAGHPQVAIVNNEAGPGWLESATEQHKNIGLYIPNPESEIFEGGRAVQITADSYPNYVEDDCCLNPAHIEFEYPAPPQLGELKLTYKPYQENRKPYKKRVPYKRRNGYF
jgi:hypothetical protein